LDFEVSERQVKYGKYVTVVRVSGGVDLESLARELKRRLGAGGTVKDGVIILQGRHRVRVEKLLPSLLTA